MIMVVLLATTSNITSTNLIISYYISYHQGVHVSEEICKIYEKDNMRFFMSPLFLYESVIRILKAF